MLFEASLRQTKNLLDKVSSSFCLAKWLQVTIHLQFGGTHSCHHLQTHRVPLKELKKNPSALHNTIKKKQQRKKMMTGERPKGCDYCWKIENLPGDCVSDRIIKSNGQWALPELEKVVSNGWDGNIDPTYVEVSFSNACNLKCLYCYPHISSSWHKEIETHGHFKLSRPHHNLKWHQFKGKKIITAEEENPYVEAFWKWWPDLYPKLKVFRITGGEPLLTPSTYRIFDYIENQPNPELEVSINTNLAVQSKMVSKLAAKINSIIQKKAIRQFHIFTSLDSWGPQAEYIRSGLDLKLFDENMKLLNKEIPSLHMTIMCTFNILSPYAFKELLDQLLVYKKALKENKGSLLLDISYLRDPLFMDIHLLPVEHFHIMEECLAHMKSHQSLDPGNGFSPYEISKFERVIDYYHSPTFKTLERSKKDFSQFVKEIDRRRGCSFEEVFPLLSKAMA